MFTVAFIIILAAITATLYHAVTGKVPLWVAVLLLCIVAALQYLPLK